jgi:hypothetical protein
MKRVIYDSLSVINQAFEQIPENLEKLRDLGVITAEYVETQRVLSEELRAAINFMLLNNCNPAKKKTASTSERC